MRVPLFSRLAPGLLWSGRPDVGPLAEPLAPGFFTELEADLSTRHLDDGSSVAEALALEREHLRAMPAHLGLFAGGGGILR